MTQYWGQVTDTNFMIGSLASNERDFFNTEQNWAHSWNKTEWKIFRENSKHKQIHQRNPNQKLWQELGSNSSKKFWCYIFTLFSLFLVFKTGTCHHADHCYLAVKRNSVILESKLFCGKFRCFLYHWTSSNCDLENTHLKNRSEREHVWDVF